MLRNHDVQEPTVDPLSILEYHKRFLLLLYIGSVCFDLGLVFLSVIILLPVLDAAGLHYNVIKLADDEGSTEVDNDTDRTVLSNVNGDHDREDH